MRPAADDNMRLAAVAAEHLAYRTVAACWEADVHEAGPLLDREQAQAFAGQLHDVAAALRRRAPAPSVEDAPDFMAADVAALTGALGR